MSFNILAALKGPKPKKSLDGLNDLEVKKNEGESLKSTQSSKASKAKKPSGSNTNASGKKFRVNTSNIQAEILAYLNSLNADHAKAILFTVKDVLIGAVGAQDVDKVWAVCIPKNFQGDLAGQNLGANEQTIKSAMMTGALFLDAAAALEFSGVSEAVIKNLCKTRLALIEVLKVWLGILKVDNLSAEFKKFLNSISGVDVFAKAQEAINAQATTGVQALFARGVNLIKDQVSGAKTPVPAGDQATITSQARAAWGSIVGGISAASSATMNKVQSIADPLVKKAEVLYEQISEKTKAAQVFSQVKGAVSAVQSRMEQVTDKALSQGINLAMEHLKATQILKTIEDRVKSFIDLFYTTYSVQIDMILKIINLVNACADEAQKADKTITQNFNFTVVQLLSTIEFFKMTGMMFSSGTLAPLGIILLVDYYIGVSCEVDRLKVFRPKLQASTPFNEFARAFGGLLNVSISGQNSGKDMAPFIKYYIDLYEKNSVTGVILNSQEVQGLLKNTLSHISDVSSAEFEKSKQELKKIILSP